jgi:hypothetical protein
MNGTAARFLRLSVSLSGLVVLGWVLTGQAAKPADRGIPLPTDWSHSHVIFSRPATEEQMRSVADDPRYWQQLHRQAQSLVLSPEASSLPSIQAGGRAASKGLWSEDLGPSATPGAGNYPAKFAFNSTVANCGSAATPDYVVYSTGLLGAGAQASVVAYDNLYTGCGGTVPTTYWAYNTGGLVLTSPVISLDGTQVAFVQTSGSPVGQAGLVILKWKASATETVFAPGVPTVTTNALYPGCTAPCMTEVFLHGGGTALDDRTSSPFYDYTGDIAWVGGANGWLHKITGVFKGTALLPPKEVNTGGFPAQMSPPSTNTLSDPVYDPLSKNVFVADAGGFFYRVASATGAAVKSAELDFGAGFPQSPVLDITNGRLYVFSSSDGTATTCAPAACSAIFLLGTSFAAGATGTKVTVGSSVVTGSLPNPNPLYIGGFDSTYFGSVGGTGNLYVCGNTGSVPTLYRVPVAPGSFGPALAVAQVAKPATTPSCSPVTDFSNPSTSVGTAEHVYFSVQSHGLPCANAGCIMNFVDMPWQASTHYNVGQQVLILRAADNTVYLNVAVVSGTTGATVPVWPAAPGTKKVDGGVTWLNQGPISFTPLPGWTTGNHGAQARILDTNGNVEIIIVAGASGALAPVWNTTIGGTTVDNAVTWINAGPWSNAGLTVTAGTGGIIIDNSVSSTTLAGASQVYFFTLGNHLCSTSGGTGSCAMQASQSALK